MSNVAELGPRVGAAIIDILIFMALGIPAAVLGGIYGDVKNAPKELEVAAMIFAGVGFLILFGVTLGLLYRHGQSIGKRLMGIQIVRSTTGEQVGFARVLFLRMFAPNILYSVPVLNALLLLVNVILLFVPGRRLIHDYIGGTAVHTLNRE